MRSTSVKTDQPAVTNGGASHADGRSESMPKEAVPPPTMPPWKDPLLALAASINEEHAAGDEDEMGALRHYLRAGQQLRDAKSRVKHGEWLPWMRENLVFSEDTAENYMLLARHSERVRDSGASSLRKALAVVRDASSRTKSRTGGGTWPPQEQLPLEDPAARALAIRHLQRAGNTPDEHDFREALESLDLAKRRLAELIQAILDLDRGVVTVDELVDLARSFARPDVEKQSRRPKTTHRSQKSTAVGT